MTRRGLTLIELLVAAIIGAAVAAATTIAIAQTIQAREAARGRQQAFARAQAAASRIELDAQAALREGDLYFGRVAILDAEAGPNDRDQLLVYAKSVDAILSAGLDAPEGMEYEFQYRLEGTPTRPIVRGTRPTRQDAKPMTLWRRVDPVPDEMPEGGGVAFPFADFITSLSVEAYDGDVWSQAWDSDFDGYPHALRVEVRATSDDLRYVVSARRVIPFDRMPTPWAGVAADDAENGGEQ